MDSAEDSETREEAVKLRIRQAAQRASAEASARREAADAKAARAGSSPKELNGRGGLDPVRHGDWEVNGVASDF
jgi:hypothetical protein